MNLRPWHVFLRPAAVVFGGLLLVAGCGDEDHDDHDDHGEHGEHGEVSAVEDACEHFGEGPAAAVTAGADAAAAAALANSHTDYTVTTAGGAGFVQIPVAEATELTVVLSEAATVAITDLAGNSVAPEATPMYNGAPCEAAQIGLVFDAEVGTYVLELSSVPNDSVRIVVVPAEEGHEHEHGG
jgi:hypothetical protein